MNHTIIIYSADDSGDVKVKLEGDNLWLTQKQLAELFDKDVRTINEHIKNVYQEAELSESSTVRNFRTVQIEGKREVTREIAHYNLDLIISVGYRVNSKRGTQFRQWATRILREHLLQGWTLDRERFERNASELEAALSLIKKTASSPLLTADTGRGLVNIVSRYTQTFLLLQRYDEGLLTSPSGTPGGQLPSIDIVRQLIASLKTDLIQRGEATPLFGLERSEALAALLGNLDQTVFGEPAYPTIETKAAHLLYFVIKNHPLSDGNKRTGAYLFVDFLNRNHALMRDGQPIINDIGLAALALLVAESMPEQKNTMIRLIENMLAKPE